MQVRRSDIFTTIRTEGAILPSDLLQRIAEGDREVGGLTPSDYHLLENEKLNEAANRSWNRLLGSWAAFKDAARKLPSGDPGTSVTRERWLLVLFQELGYGRLQSSRAVEIDGKSYPISHFWQRVPIHLVGCGTPMDQRTAGVAGAARISPHGLVQEYLNRSDASLWGMVSNGLRLRILRDNVSLTRQAYVEFDLEAMMNGEVYSDFALLWLLCHQSRFEGEKPESCHLEQWSRFAQEQGTRALDQLRDGVSQAIEALGRGFLHPSNVELRDRLRAGRLDKQDYYRQLLRLVYRLLFLFVAEDRNLLCHPDAGMLARERYVRYYSTARLRRLAERRRGSRHTDLFESLRVVMAKLGSDDGCPELGLPALGSFLFSGRAVPDLDAAVITNEDFLEAIRALAITTERKIFRLVDYKNLGSEELGSVYESLLELHPELNLDAGAFSLSTAGGHERKTTGSYYTPTSLITCLLDSALDPIVDEACKKPEPEKALLALKVCDPACGSGHFLIAAAHRLAKRLAAIRTGDEEPSPEATRTAIRDVIGHCIYGVDVNEMAVELCKVALWMEALEPGKPLSFLDHHIRCGNSLLGTTPALLEKGISDEAFQPIEGDDRSFASALKKLNKVERNQMSLPLAAEDQLPFGSLADGVAYLDSVNDNSISGVHEKEASYTRLRTSEDYRRAKLLADAWCAAFVWKKRKDTPQAVTQDVFRRLQKARPQVPPDTIGEIERLATQYNLFHWHLAFPDVFRIPPEGQSPENAQTGWTGGFDVVLGNPPWVRQELLKAVKSLFVTFESFCSTVDSSVLFLERAVQVTQTGRRIGLLTPNKWFRAAYGELLRAFLREHARLHLLVDFGHSHNLFRGQDTFPAAIVLEPVLERVPDDQRLRFVRAHDTDRNLSSLEKLVSDRVLGVAHGDLHRNRWQLANNDENRLHERLTRVGQPLSTCVGAMPLSGIKTGLNEAYYVNSKVRDVLISDDPACEPLLKRLLRGRDIRRWTSKWDEQWHIVIPSSQNQTWPWSGTAREDLAEQIFALTYPSIHQHLISFKERLGKRADRGRFWWELRPCDYYSVFAQPKIVVQCIAYFSRFSLDLEGHCVNNKILLIPSGDLYLTGILNSRIIWWLINRTFQHMKDDGLSIDVQFLVDLPIPSPSPERSNAIAETVRNLLNSSDSIQTELELRLNRLVEEAFELTPQERQILENSLPPRDPVEMLTTASSNDVLGASDD
ncbi:MAG TPA: N-6 DNA methylase [Acidobacteriota bacterium]|nr:N-6 DNA methylase [Acidobacteriota bacterium]